MALPEVHLRRLVTANIATAQPMVQRVPVVTGVVQVRPIILKWMLRKLTQPVRTQLSPQTT